MENDIKAVLQTLNIDFELYEHPAFTSCEISAAWHQEHQMPGQRVKNLFLRNKNGKRHFLLLLPHAINFDKAIFKTLSTQKCGLASNERLLECLGVKPGSVSPLCLINDAQKQVEVYIESALMQAEYLHLHPGDATKSIKLSPDDLIALLVHWQYDPQIVDWSAATLPD